MHTGPFFLCVFGRISYHHKTPGPASMWSWFAFLVAVWSVLDHRKRLKWICHENQKSVSSCSNFFIFSNTHEIDYSIEYTYLIMFFWAHCLDILLWTDPNPRSIRCSNASSTKEQKLEQHKQNLMNKCQQNMSFSLRSTWTASNANKTWAKTKLNRTFSRSMMNSNRAPYSGRCILFPWFLFVFLLYIIYYIIVIFHYGHLLHVHFVPHSHWSSRTALVTASTTQREPRHVWIWPDFRVVSSNR